MCVLAATLGADDLYVFTVRNSWSTAWGDEGNFLASEAWLLADGVSDVYAIAPTRKAS